MTPRSLPVWLAGIVAELELDRPTKRTRTITSGYMVRGEIVEARAELNAYSVLRPAAAAVGR